MRVSQSDGKIWSKCSDADFTRVWDPLICWLSKCVLERCFLERCLTTFFTFCNFGNKLGMAIIFFSKMFKIWFRFQKWNNKIWKKNLVSNRSAFQSGTTNSQTPEYDNCHWQSMCYETPLRFNISLREIFYKSGSPRVMEKYDESTVLQILQEFGTL